MFAKAKTLFTTHKRGKIYLATRYVTVVASLLTWILVLCRGLRDVEADVFALAFAAAIFIFSTIDIIFALPMVFPIIIDLIFTLGLLTSIPFNIKKVVAITRELHDYGYRASSNSHIQPVQTQPVFLKRQVEPALRTGELPSTSTPVIKPMLIVPFENLLNNFIELMKADEEIRASVRNEMEGDIRATRSGTATTTAEKWNEFGFGGYSWNSDYTYLAWSWKQREYGVPIIVFSCIAVVSAVAGWVMVVRQCRIKNRMKREEQLRLAGKLGPSEETIGRAF
ncbi:hypothetical protein BJ508DRAFT_373759 [Ascobolus immersus RN42]|uniref:Uncharacterized protein n=1 Tax=Ascobolus immersus RN42 TaxID=1160509 RepID=A0A3N4IIZ3_ASCIM|nr:hypothetical protein BJ508DRAFT_373759 [Ascobolus immersus RN42]